MSAATIHCPGCGEALQVSVLVHRVINPPQDNTITVTFQDAEVEHECPNAGQDRKRQPWESP